MGAAAGFALRFIQWFNRGVQFASSGLILALTSYFLAAMSDHKIDIPTKLRAVEGISGIGVLYTAFGILLVCCLAGFTLTSFIAMVLDVAFVGAFIFVATVYKDGASSCSGSSVSTVFGTGSAGDKVTSNASGNVPLPTFRTACKMESASLAVAIVAIIFFIISALTELGLGRHRKKEQRFGPSPANNYTSGYGSKRTSTATGGRRGFGSLFRRSRSVKNPDENELPSHPEPGALRESYEGPADATTTTAYPKYGEAGVDYGQHATTTTTNNNHNAGGYGGMGGYGNQYRYSDGTYNV